MAIMFTFPVVPATSQVPINWKSQSQIDFFLEQLIWLYKKGEYVTNT